MAIELPIVISDEWISDGDGFRNIMTGEYMDEDKFLDAWNA